MAPRIDALFPTFLLRADYPQAAADNATLIDSAYAIREADTRGQAWSKEQYGVGFTSYASGVDIVRYPGLRSLAEFIVSQAAEFSGYLDIDTDAVALGMTDLWVNINPTYSYHSEHLHGDSVFSGVYYVQTPPRCGAIVFRDPRPVTAMLRPPYRVKSARNSDSVRLEPQAGTLVMFPAWLLHAVEQNLSETDRVSISFNFGLRYTAPARSVGTSDASG